MADLYIKVLPDKPFLFDILLSFLDAGVFNTKKGVYPNFPLKLKIENCVLGEVLSIYFNDKKVAEIIANAETMFWDFEPDWDNETNKIYVSGTAHDKFSNVVYFFPQNFAVFLWLFSEKFVEIIQELAQSKQDFFIQNSVGDALNKEFKTGKDYYELSKYVYSEIIPPLKDFVEEKLKRAYFLQTAYNWKTTMFISLVLFYEIFYPYLKDKLDGKVFPLWIPYDEVETFTFRKMVENVSGARINFSQDTFYRLSVSYSIGTNPEYFDILVTGYKVTYSLYKENIRHKGVKMFIERAEATDFFKRVNLGYVSFSEKIHRDVDGRYTGDKSAYFAFLAPPLFSYEYQFLIDYVSGLEGIKIKNRVILEVPYVPPAPAVLDINRLCYERYIPIYYFYYDGLKINTLWEPSFLTNSKWDLRIFSNEGYADGELYVSLRDDLIDAGTKRLTSEGKQVVSAMGFYWELSKLVNRKLYLLVGIFDTLQDDFYLDKAKPIFWKHFGYWKHFIE